MLEPLKRKRLLEIADGEGVSLAQRRAVAPIRDALVAKRSLKIETILSYLGRDELKAVCRALELDDTGRAKASLRDRVRAHGKTARGRRRTRSGSTETSAPRMKSLVGAAFSFPINRELNGACRVIQQCIHQGVLVQTCDWVGSRVPDPKDSALRPCLDRDESGWFTGVDNRHWISPDQRIPETFDYLGIVEPSAEERRVFCGLHGYWSDIQPNRLLQWRWVSEREVVRQELIQRRDAWQREQKEARWEGLAPAPKVPSLAELRRRTAFENWRHHAPAKGLKAARGVIRDSLGKLADLGAEPDRSEVLKVIRAGVGHFNDLDGDVLEICTIEREDIAEWFNLMAEACGVTDMDDVTEEWRDW